MQILTKRQIFTCKHELRNIWLDMQTREERKRTLGLVYFLLDAAQLDVHPLVGENTVFESFTPTLIRQREFPLVLTVMVKWK